MDVALGVIWVKTSGPDTTASVPKISGHICVTPEMNSPLRHPLPASKGARGSLVNGAQWKYPENITPCWYLGFRPVKAPVPRGDGRLTGTRLSSGTRLSPEFAESFSERKAEAQNAGAPAFRVGSEDTPRDSVKDVTYGDACPLDGHLRPDGPSVRGGRGQACALRPPQGLLGLDVPLLATAVGETRFLLTRHWLGPSVDPRGQWTLHSHAPSPTAHRQAGYWPTAALAAPGPEEDSARRELSGQEAGEPLLRRQGTWGQRPRLHGMCCIWCSPEGLHLAARAGYVCDKDKRVDSKEKNRNVIRTTGFMKGLYTDAEMKSDNVKDKDTKISFLQKAIDVVVMVSGEPLLAKPARIVAGHEPERTNELLQRIGKCCLNKLSSDDAVKRVLAGEKAETKGRSSLTSKPQELDNKNDRRNSEVNERNTSGGRKQKEELKEENKPREKERDREKPKENDRDRHKDPERDKYHEGERERAKNRARPERDRAKDAEREREPKNEGGKEKEKRKERERERERDRGRDRQRARNGQHGGDPDREKSHERDRPEKKASPVGKPLPLAWKGFVVNLGFSRKFFWFQTLFFRCAGYFGLAVDRSSSSGEMSKKSSGGSFKDSKAETETEISTRASRSVTTKTSKRRSKNSVEGRRDSRTSENSLSPEKERNSSSSKAEKEHTGKQLGRKEDDISAKILDPIVSGLNNEPDQETTTSEIGTKEANTHSASVSDANSSSLQRESAEPEPAEKCEVPENSELPGELPAAVRFEDTSARERKARTSPGQAAGETGSGKTISNVIVESQNSDNEDDDQFVVEAAPQLSEVSELEMVQAVELEDEKHGGLVKKILETKKDYEKLQQSPRPGEKVTK
ncbi:hypothetical protein E2I00_000754 [Balaenoptera physalus]|uniref:TRAF3-interacting protein 1 n=1 Tax=Balaenoptera physalus TaxID=9770 RepID=A0A6A1QJM4_BALPH|nr:hypothetical protein E2I00_000754 [Balaenoptera physalus]